ncbi:MAG: bifunctional pyr operon transcriptional regulator/uracil phosphoribosyltransferase PyrR [Elusimicrobiota bacterium]|jgi:pyrimidine operon attenuation protein/uracil phosphoribosyltransferase|nr:bifunctional pyr operon transcriptional regulator/uracil phosphoribosyltransferase PyrR [Elusimicrobiota bacterium]
MQGKNQKIIMDDKKLNQTINRIVDEILEKTDDLDKLVIIGLQTRGVFLAKRIIKKIKKLENTKIPLGIIDISLYRDDFYENPTDLSLKETDLPFNVDDKNVILIDDVLYTGRSVRAAMECIMDFGRPKSIKLAVLIDRGNRELPIQPDIFGKNFVTRKNIEIISVKLKEVDDFDSVFLINKGEFDVKSKRFN